MEGFRFRNPGGDSDSDGRSRLKDEEDDFFPWEVEAALQAPMRKVIRHRADLTDEQISQELADRTAADEEKIRRRAPILRQMFTNNHHHQ